MLVYTLTLPEFIGSPLQDNAWYVTGRNTARLAMLDSADADEQEGGTSLLSAQR